MALPEILTFTDSEAASCCAKQCREEIFKMYEFLWEALFPGDTWAFRQTACYGFGLKGLTDEKEEAFVQQILQELKERGILSYIEKAYHFIDNLTAHACGLTVEGEILVEHLRGLEGKIESLREKFGDFLEKDADTAFTLTMNLSDPDKPSFQIGNLEFDKEELSQKWAGFSSAIEAELETAGFKD
ncbi:hypothetical protein ISS42_03320 [Candidatus Shapirobacteria bacterium]|nr:hypothetical protein [Candidatus Shapirobacteria bacterium]